MSDHLRLTHNPLWRTIQGEGLDAGKPAMFLRLAGCDLRCSWCDTKHSLEDYDPVQKRFLPVEAFPYHQDASIVQLLESMLALPAHHRHSLWVFTGGEPTLQVEGLEKLWAGMCAWDGQGPQLSIETNGNTGDALGKLPLLLSRSFGLVSMSPKLFRLVTSDGMRSFHAAHKAWALANCRIQVKIVASSFDEVEAAYCVLERFAAASAWAGVQLESSFLATTWRTDKTQRMMALELFESKRIRLVAQMHPVLRLR